MRQQKARQQWPRCVAVLLGAAAAFGAVGTTAMAASPRDACEAALVAEAAGRTDVSSRGPCHQAMLLDGSARDYRNEVASLMSPATRPSLDDLVMTGLLTEAATRKSPEQPWGYIARCDVARRLGNADLMRACLSEMKRVAPMGAQAAGFAPVAPRAGMVILRLILLASLGATLVHSIRRRQRRPRAPSASFITPPASVLAFTLAAVLIGGPRIARAENVPTENLSQFRIDDADPESSVPTPEQQNAKPLEFGYFLQDLAAKAEKAAKAQDHLAEARYYRALTKAAPMSAAGPRKLCDALHAAGDLKNAVIACRTALTRDGATTGDYLHFVQVVLATPGPLSRDEHAELNSVLLHMESETNLGALPWMFHCEIALRFSDHDELTACTSELARRAPNDPKTVSFQWALAMQNHDTAAAKRLIDRARALHMSPAGVSKMEQATGALTWRWLGRLAVAALAVALILCGGFVAFRRATKARLASVQLRPEA